MIVINRLTGNEQLVLEPFPRPSPIGMDKLAVGIFSLQILHVRVRRRVVEVEIVLPDIPVVRLVVGQPEFGLFEDRIQSLSQ